MPSVAAASFPAVGLPCEAALGLFGPPLPLPAGNNLLLSRLQEKWKVQGFLPRQGRFVPTSAPFPSSSLCLPPWLQRTWSSASIYPAATLDLRAGSCLAVPPLLDGQSQLPALSHICLPWKSQHVSDTDLLCWCPAWGAGCLAGSHHLALGRQSIAAGCVSLGTSPARPGDLTHSLLFPHGSLGTP